MPWSGILGSLVACRSLILGRRECARGEPAHHVVSEPLSGPATFWSRPVVRLFLVLGHGSSPSGAPTMDAAALFTPPVARRVTVAIRVGSGRCRRSWLR